MLRPPSPVRGQQFGWYVTCLLLFYVIYVKFEFQSIGHLLQELGGTRTHGPPCSEAHRQEGVAQRLTDALVLAPLRGIALIQPARRHIT